MESNKRSFIVRNIILKNGDGWRMNHLKTFKIFLIFNSSRKEKIPHFFGHTLIFCSHFLYLCEQLFARHLWYGIYQGVIHIVHTHQNHQTRSLSPPCTQSHAFGLIPLYTYVLAIYSPTTPPPPTLPLLINFYSDSSFRHSQFLGYFHFYLPLRLNFTKPISKGFLLFPFIA